jgi:hypothetical protein
LVGNNHGIYALYRDKNLYYVGLARNLKRRVKHHLEDRHAGRWNFFSMYLVRSELNLRDLESLAIRISFPEANRTRGKFGGAPDLKKALKKKLTSRAKDKIRRTLGGVGLSAGSSGDTALPAGPERRKRRERSGPFAEVVKEVLTQEGSYLVLASRPRVVNFIPDTWASVLPDNGTAWRGFSRRVGVCCWFAARPGRVRLAFEVSRMDDPKVRMACAQALRDAGFRLQSSAFRPDAKFSRFFSVRADVPSIEDPAVVRPVVQGLLAKAKERFPKAEAVFRRVFAGKV